ncbi:MAG: LysE family transporter [Rhodoferax sp.]|jgi:threonine efflux protein|nr:LysE family transporter [Rhodoferax sp.]
MPFAFDLSVLATFTLMWIAVVPTPGPNILMVTHVAITRTPAHVAYAIAGNMAGIALLASLALIGWAAILETFPWLRVGVSIFGGLYLIWVGTRLVRRARRSGSAEPAPLSPTADTPAGGADKTADYRRTALLGLVTALSNAQAILFITSFFAVAGVLHANAATGVATVIIILCCNATYLSVLGWLFQREKMRAGYARYRGVLEGATGSLFILFGGRLLWRALAR